MFSPGLHDKCEMAKTGIVVECNICRLHENCVSGLQRFLVSTTTTTKHISCNQTVDVMQMRCKCKIFIHHVKSPIILFETGDVRGVQCVPSFCIFLSSLCCNDKFYHDHHDHPSYDRCLSSFCCNYKFYHHHYHHHHHHFQLPAISHENLAQSVPPSSSTCSGTEPLGFRQPGFYRLHVQQSASKHHRQTALTLNKKSRLCTCASSH